MEKTSGIRDFFSPKNKNDHVQNFLSKRITEEIEKQKAVKEQDIVDVDFYKNKVVTLENEISKLKKDNSDLKKLMNKSNQINLKKDLLIAELKKQIDENRSSILNSASHIKDKKQKILFEQFEDKIQKTDLIRLRSINDTKEKDSTFILQSLKILYKEDISALSKKTATTTTSTKQEMTPEKKCAIQQLFSERLSAMNLSAEQELDRQSRFRCLLSNAISSVNKTTKTSTDSSHTTSTPP